MCSAKVQLNQAEQNLQKDFPCNRAFCSGISLGLSSVGLCRKINGTKLNKSLIIIEIWRHLLRTVVAARHIVKMRSIGRGKSVPGQSCHAYMTPSIGVTTKNGSGEGSDE